MSRARRQSNDFTPVEVKSAMRRRSSQSSLQDTIGELHSGSILTRTSSQCNLQDVFGEADSGDVSSCMSSRSSMQEPFSPVEIRSAFTRVTSRSTLQDASSEIRKFTMSRTRQQTHDHTPVEVRSGLTCASTRSSMQDSLDELELRSVLAHTNSGSSLVSEIEAISAPRCSNRGDIQRSSSGMLEVHSMDGLSMQHLPGSPMSCQAVNGSDSGSAPRPFLQPLPRLLGILPSATVYRKGKMPESRSVVDTHERFEEFMSRHFRRSSSIHSQDSLVSYNDEASVSTAAHCAVNKQHCKQIAWAEPGTAKGYKQRASRAIGRIACMFSRMW